MIRRSEDRFRTVADGIETRHSFSHGVHYDPANVAFGPVVAINDERLAPCSGYDWHRHADVEIYTVVLEGALAHVDSVGGAAEVVPGAVRHTSAADGIEHTERNASDVAPLRFLQVMTREPVDVRIVEEAMTIQGPAIVHVVDGDEARLGAGEHYAVDGRAAVVIRWEEQA